MAYPQVHPAAYLFRNQDGEVIYVGSSVNPAERLLSHGSQRSWWPEVATIELRHFPTVAEARAHESACIQALNPRYNIIGRTDLPKERRAVRSMRNGKCYDPWDKFPGHRDLFQKLRQLVYFSCLTDRAMAETLGLDAPSWRRLGSRADGIPDAVITRAYEAFPELLPRCRVTGEEARETPELATT